MIFLCVSYRSMLMLTCTKLQLKIRILLPFILLGVEEAENNDFYHFLDIFPCRSSTNYKNGCLKPCNGDGAELFEVHVAGPASNIRQRQEGNVVHENSYTIFGYIFYGGGFLRLVIYIKFLHNSRLRAFSQIIPL